MEWALGVFGRFGAAGLFVVAFAESSFFPVPPDVMLLPMCVAHPRSAAWYAVITTASSVLGAAFGYLVGARGGRPLLLKFTDEQGLRTVQRLFDKYGGWAVGIAAFTPIPYKVFTIASGIFRVRLTPFFTASIIGRGGRFFLEAALAVRYGEAFREIVGPRFEVITLLLGLGAAALAVALGRARKRTGAGANVVASRGFARVRLPERIARFSRHQRNALAEWFIYLLAGFIFLLILLEEVAELAASGAIPIIRSVDTRIALAIASVRHPALTWVLMGAAFLTSYPAVFAGLGLAVFLFMSRPGGCRRIQAAALVSCVLGSAGLAILAGLTQSIAGPMPAAGVPQLLTRSAGAGGLLVSACFYGMLSVILRRHAATAASLGPVMAAYILVASSAFAWVYLGLAWPSEAAAELIAAGMWLLICGRLMALVERNQLS